MQRQQKALNHLKSGNASNSNNVERLVTQQLKGGLLRRGNGGKKVSSDQKSNEFNETSNNESMPDFVSKPRTSLLGLDKLAATKRLNQSDEKRNAAKLKLFGSGRVLSSAAQEFGDEGSIY